MSSTSLRIGIVQENPVVGDIKGNTKLAIKCIQTLKNNSNPHVIVFSEMFLTGYPPEDLLYREDLLDDVDKSLKKLSKVSPNIYLVIGYPRKKKNKLFNSAGVIYKGSLQLEYFKQELPNYKVFDEKRYFSPGKGPCLFEVKGKKIALTICEDIWHTKAIRQAARRGAELVLNLNASPFHRNKFEERKELVSRHAKQFNLPIIYINQVGGQDELVFDGASMIISPTGECLVTFPSFKTHTESIEIELSGRRLVNEKNIINQKSRSELQDLYEALVLGTKDYIRKNGFSGAIIGSSGGIDSALTAVIAVDAIGSDQVKTFMMPFDYTAQMSIEDANKLAKNLGISHKVINIKDIFSSFEKSLEEVFLGKEKDKTEENLQSRSRGVLLMAISNKLGSLVLTTGNKSETAVGYSTLYGDTAGGFSVLKDVPKTWVYQLAKYRNTIKEVIPQRIIDRQPSAELAPNQKDSDSLPDYEILDKIIELYVEKDASIEDIVSKGLDKKTAEEVIRLIDKSEYKRRQAPPGVRITDRGFGKDRRYPITNRYSQ